MKFNDDVTAEIASTVKDVLEGKAVSKKEEVKYPHMMYAPDGSKEVEVKDKAEHEVSWGQSNEALLSHYLWMTTQVTYCVCGPMVIRWLG